MHLPLSGIDLARIGAELEVESRRCAAIERESFFGRRMLAQIQAHRYLVAAGALVGHSHVRDPGHLEHEVVHPLRQRQIEDRQ